MPGRRNWFGVVVLCVFLSGLNAVGALMSPFIVNPANGHQYALLTSATWTSSEAEAVALGGHLATIRNQAEQNWVFQNFGRYGGVSRLLWIGISDRVAEGTFGWSSGASLSYTNWAPGEPNGGGSEDFVAMYYPGHNAQGGWNDWDDRTADPIGIPFNGVIELAPETVMTLVSTGSVWRYWDRGPNGLDPNWRATNFNDSGWSSGRAQLGYNDGDEATTVGFGGDPNNRYITTCFRRQFVATNVHLLSNLVLRVLRDDGAVVYLNGREVFRSNMPVGSAITFNTLAAGTVTDGDESTNFFSTRLSSTNLINGTNLLAVEIHQVTNNSTDISFDLELVGVVGPGQPLLQYERAGDGMVLRWPDLPTGYVVDSTAAMTPTRFWKPFTGTATDSNGFYRMVVTNSGGAAYFRLRRP